MVSAKPNSNGHQNVIVMRHGDRVDHLEPLWLPTAKRPWDPPLAHDGMVRAFGTGQRIRSHSGFPIHRIFVSPFLRCIQTASEVVAALSAVDLDPNAMSSKDVLSVDNSTLKVAIEYGLCEILNTVAIKTEVAPKDKKFDFKISDLEAMFPEGMVDHNVDMVYKELPQWEESVESFKKRYANTLKVLAEKYPSENLLLITHWGGVSSTLYKYFKDATKYLVDYCGSVDLRRQILDKDGFGESVKFEVVTSHGVSFKDHKVPIHDHVVAIEFGLREFMNERAIKCEVARKEKKFDFKISDLEVMFPEGMMDHNVDMIYKELPQWGESAESSRDRYINTMKVLAQKYPSENVLLITHRGGISSTLYKYFKDATKYLVDRCACVELRRPFVNKDAFGEPLEFEVVNY